MNANLKLALRFIENNLGVVIITMQRYNFRAKPKAEVPGYHETVSEFVLTVSLEKLGKVPGLLGRGSGTESCATIDFKCSACECTGVRKAS